MISLLVYRIFLFVLISEGFMIINYSFLINTKAMTESNVGKKRYVIRLEKKVKVLFTPSLHTLTRVTCVPSLRLCIIWTQQRPVYK